MASKWNGQPCSLCGVGTLHDRVKKITKKYKGRVFSSQTHGAFCDHCAGSFIEDSDATEASWLAFCAQIHIEQAVELAGIRKKLGLTQTEAAKITGGGKNAFTRYEHGQTKPATAVLNLFRLLDRHPELLDELTIR